MSRLATVVLCCVLALPARAQEQAGDGPRDATSTVFARYSDRILKVQIIESSSSAKRSIGTAFFVSSDGLMLTNYHVISDHIHERDDNRVEVLQQDGTAIPAVVVAVDVVHDLAILRTGLVTPSFFTLGPVALRQGDRLYSLGHPSDLGLSIVEGTYNGNLKHTLSPKIHFTGSINPGMSGGPTITSDGRVVGVNVSTMGEQRSFLVPEGQATALVARVRAPGFAAAPDPFTEITAQLTDFQDSYLRTLFVEAPKRVDVGPFNVVSEPTPYFRCWGGSQRSDDRDKTPMYVQTWHNCGTDDDVFVAGEQRVGVVAVKHLAITSERLNAARFGALFTSRFGLDPTPSGDEKHVTVWKCRARNVAAPATPVRAVLCLRGLKKLPGLYDAVLQVAVLGRSNAGLVSSLTLSGATFENIDQASTRFLGLLAWR
ncbi:MAG: trypsin-like peptidase domain-containing protein [Gemmatimonadaceae bacterium]|nr:trypsin-like peptidase domain-containing protein [Gemmatimonadaceae bacterium]